MKLFFLFFLFFPFSVQASLDVALNWKAEPQFGGFYEAERRGLFKDLSVKLLQGGSGTPTVQMLANEKVDLAVVSAEEILIHNDRNPKNPIIAIFASFQVSPVVIMTHEERGFTELKEVFTSPGVIAMQSGLSYAKFLLKKYGKPKARIVPYLGGITNFLQNKNYSQQGFLTSEPIAAEKAGKKVKSFLVADEGFNPYVTVVAVRKSYLQKNSKKVESFIAALRLGWEHYLLHPEPANKVMHELNKSMDLATFQKSAEAQASLIRDKKRLGFKIGTMHTSRWEQLIEQMKDLGFIKKTLPAKKMFQNIEPQSPKKQ